MTTGVPGDGDPSLDFSLVSLFGAKSASRIVRLLRVSERAS